MLYAPLGGGPCHQGGCQYCRLGIKEHFISVCDSKREREASVIDGVCGCPGWPVYIKAPRGGPKVMYHPPDYRQAP